MVKTIILVLALGAGMYVVVISALALIFYLMNPLRASQPEMDLRAARKRGIA